jgi:hypothetical protein
MRGSCGVIRREDLDPDAMAADFPTAAALLFRPIDRYYIERFSKGSASDIRGRVLEVR